jgi:hypothetical protein
MTREAWLIVNSMVNGVRAADSCYCGDVDGTEKEMDAQGYNDIVEGLAKELSRNMLENSITILTKALKLAEKIRVRGWERIGDGVANVGGIAKLELPKTEG